MGGQGLELACPVLEIGQANYQSECSILLNEWPAARVSSSWHPVYKTPAFGGKFFINRVPEFLLRKEGRNEGEIVQIVVPRRV